MCVKKIKFSVIHNKNRNTKILCKMQEVCSSIDPQMGPQIKSESPLTPLQQSPQQQQQQVVVANKLVPNCDKRLDTSYWMGSESGFINSQPSMAEFLTHLSPESPKLSNQVYPVAPTEGMDGVPEYPWMKEKKTARKNNSQGKKFFFSFIQNLFLLNNTKIYILFLYYSIIIIK